MTGALLEVFAFSNAMDRCVLVALTGWVRLLPDDVNLALRECERRVVEGHSERSNSSVYVGVRSVNTFTAYSSQGTTTVDRLRACQVGRARLYGELRWLEENPAEVDDLVEAGRAISRRIRALKRLVEIELKEHRLRGHEPHIDLHDPLVKEVVALLVDSLINVTRDVVSADDADEIVEMFESRVRGNPDIPWP